ncbi:glycoside hydrolase N-terminal domain-containing protein [Cohnella sp. REN36]|uniref:glycoside hydrolase family 95 protein n=1 Tax=Cohnella sp. REN36 TaxID=2887347 RepID=UPI001D1478EC|nr:glycoside hydrolase family 95 protein [Cohnella sp. REN36]MCC3371466.1 glycoside hydrolase family 95 protein [Cohnella sp. REN36]
MRGNTEMMNRDMRLKYRGAASGWQQGLPIGNGRLGAVVFGGAEDETWSVTEMTYWSGCSEPSRSPIRGKEFLARIREPFFADDYERGESLVESLWQPEKGNFGTHLTLCDVRLQFDRAGGDGPAAINRELCLERAVVRTDVEAGGVQVSREVLASHPDGVIAARIRSGAPGGVSFSLTLEGRTDRFAFAPKDGHSLAFEGQAVETMHSDGECGVRCRGVVRVSAQGGAVRAEDGRLVVREADEATIYLAAHTDYLAADDGWREEGERLAAQAAGKGFGRILDDHVADYRSLYARVALDLGATERAGMSTDERIRRLAEAPDADPQLYALFYQYGRYLTIAGSREDSPLPLNLQGLWNDGEANRMAWSCDYHLDINTQMNYYPTDAANLPECHLPLARFVRRLAEAGESTARELYGCEGWVAHVFTNAWGFTDPGWHYSWGMNVTGGLWIADLLREHYEYTLDRGFLEETAYPVLRSAALFFLDYMTPHPKTGELVTGPSNSPENSFYPAAGTPAPGTGRAHALSMGPTLDMALVRSLLAFCLTSAELLEADQTLQARITKALDRLPPLKVGGRGQLQEWLEDYGEAQPDHRHMSHLYALHPGDLVTPRGTPELAAAAYRTLENRMQREGLEDVEFTLALFASSFARLGEGERALQSLTHLIGKLCFDNLLTYSKPGIAGAETNIFVADGNFGGTAAIGEMLLRSRLGEIELLPALPTAWPTGKATGLRAKGGAEVDLVWRDGALTEAVIRAHALGDVLLRCGDASVPLSLSAGEEVRLGADLRPIPQTDTAARE